MKESLLSSTLEDYLEAIFNIVNKNKVARSMEIAELLQVKRSSVTVALRSLSEKGLINYSPRSYITLTESGLALASCVYQKHNVINKLLYNILELPKDEAEEAACKMEHGMTDAVCRKLSGLVDVLSNKSASSKKIIQSTISFSEKIDCSNNCVANNKMIE